MNTGIVNTFVQNSSLLIYSIYLEREKKNSNKIPRFSQMPSVNQVLLNPKKTSSGSVAPFINNRTYLTWELKEKFM